MGGRGSGLTEVEIVGRRGRSFGFGCPVVASWTAFSAALEGLGSNFVVEGGAAPGKPSPMPKLGTNSFAIADSVEGPATALVLKLFVRLKENGDGAGLVVELALSPKPKAGIGAGIVETDELVVNGLLNAVPSDAPNAEA